MRSVTTKAVAAAGIVALLVFVGSSQSYAQREDSDLETLRGTVKRFTTAPKGEVDGFILSDDTWVHWPPHLEDRFTAIVKKGDRVEVTGRYETLPKGEKVFEVSTLTNLATRASRTNDDRPPPRKGKGKKARARLIGPDRTVTGTVRRFTTAPKGEVDGMELSDGTVVHWPPHLERRFTAIVEKGDRVRVVGWDETKPRGKRVLEVRTVTNLATKATRTNEDAPSLPERLRRPAGDVEERLRALEEKVDQLLDEMKQLRRKK
jgi:hypothetical protein